MGTSWTKDGTYGKTCLSLTDFRPNVFMGHIGNDGSGSPNRDVGNVYPSVSVGTNDIAIEVWFKRKLLNTYNDTAEALFPIGLIGDDDAWIAFRDAQTSIRFSGSAVSLTRSWDNSAGIPVGWHHYVARFDRDGNMTLLIDSLDTGISQSIAGDSAYSFGDMPLWMMGSNEDADTGAPLPDVPVTTDPAGTYPDSLTDPFDTFDFPQYPGVLGPMAIHLGTLLTAAQIEDSIKNRTVQNLGASTTKFRAVWTDVVIPAGGWDEERRHTIRGISDKAPVRFAAPLVTGGTIGVPDSSGNANDGTLAVAGEYGQVPFGASWPPASWTTPLTGRRSRCAFGSDPFFATGGGVRDLDGL